MSAMNTATTGSTKASANIYFTFDHIHKKIVGSEFHFKKAGIPASPQYNALMSAMESQPTYTLDSVTSKRKVENKQTYAGLTRDLMKAYIGIQPDNEKLTAEFEAMIQDKKCYPTMKSWFLDTFKGFNVKKAETAIRSHKLNTYKAHVRKVQPVPKTTIDFPKASNE